MSMCPGAAIIQCITRAVNLDSDNLATPASLASKICDFLRPWPMEKTFDRARKNLSRVRSNQQWRFLRSFTRLH